VVSSALARPAGAAKTAAPSRQHRARRKKYDGIIGLHARAALADVAEKG